jgi:hypothetical protein
VLQLEGSACSRHTSGSALMLKFRSADVEDKRGMTMERKLFDALACGIGEATTRRSAMSALAAALLGAGLVPTVEARKKRKKRRKRRRHKGPGGGLDTLCCEYTCATVDPDTPPEVKHVCIPNAKPGQTRCESSFQGCSFSSADFVADCRSCAPPTGGRANLCCTYTCAVVNPGDPPEVKHVCKSNIIPGTDRCDSSFEGCSFETADFVDSCDACSPA